MPATVRDILLLIRAKEEASRAIGNVSGAMRKAAAQADAASARARAAALRAQAVQARAAGATNAQVAALRRSADGWDQHAKSIENASKKTDLFKQKMQATAAVAETAGLVMLAAGGAMALGLGKAVQTAVEWDKQVRLTFTQVDKKFKPSLQELSAIGLRVSNDIAVPFETIQQALFDVFSSTEANMPQAEALLREFAKAAVAGQTDIQTASRATIGLMNSFKVPFTDVNKLLDIQFQLVQEGVGTYEEWANRIGLVSPSAVRAGQSIEMMAAALATATRQGMNAARASTSVARAFDAMSNPKTEKALAEIGVKTRDARGNFRPLVDVLADWRKQIEKMPKAERIASIINVLKGAGGTIEARRFLQNILLTKGGLELFQDQVKEFATDKGAFQNAYKDMADSVAAKTQLLHNKWQQLKQGIGAALLPTVTKLVDGLGKLLDWFNKLPQPVKDMIAQGLVWATVLTTLGGIVLILGGLILGAAAAIATLGSAFLPVIGGIAAGIAVFAAIVVGIAALAIAVYNAYQSSANFRALLSTIWQTILAGKDIIVGFAKTLWQNFSSTVLPALKQLWQVIESQVLPAIQSFVAWARANLLPIVQQVADYFNNQLKSAFKTIADGIRTQVVPAIQELVAWWNRNKDAILPVIQAIFKAWGVMMKIAAFIIGVLIKALFAIIPATIAIVRTIAGVFVGAWHLAADVIHNLVAATKQAIQWFKNLGSATMNAMSTAKNAVVKGVNAIKNFFSNAGSWLVNAGKNIVQGFINGISSMIGKAADTAASMAKSAWTSAKNALGIHSPSKKFKEIGANVVHGFILGVQGNRKKLLSTMFSLQRDVIRSINAAHISKSAKASMRAKWNAKLQATETKLLKLETKRSALQTKLDAATKNYNDLLKQRADLVEKVSEAIASSADITDLTDKEKKSGTSIRDALKKRLEEAKVFVANLRNLAKRGFDKETIAQLASQGVDAAGTLVQTLANASDSDLKQISKTQQEIRKLAGDTGTKIAGDLYNAGIAAAKGLVKGLQSQISKITAVMTQIATALVKQIKKELGIKSPSKVFDKIGVNTAQGYINGYMKRMNDANLTTPMFGARARVGFGSNTAAVVNPGISRVYNQHITVNTQEIDPRKNSAELGWMLEGRLP